ncbi:MAG TPA: isovaleryl-CoA dehydrogenase [Oxalicibacterium sp.]|uniref:isovaleryl-CoA dehydrogenase n=1 Tax=Oxalicibacterium sp. TaxID=2766525 RepID=UPI002BC2E868|nr:isovaleryl-CoA dehydrogenase [Oxalicibacterium sp.]HWU97327.1 isovaleryl-CoA dehydrogenase [Oxalicibacterium sp.]
MQWPTHDVANQVPDLPDCNLFTTDQALVDAVRRDAGWHEHDLIRSGAELGTCAMRDIAAQANHHLPELHTHDRVGNRIDAVEFHSAWHQLLAMQRRENLQALPWSEPRDGAHLARTAGYFLQAQLESGSLCPITMTFAAIPLLQKEPALFGELEAKLFSREHDARDLPIAQKRSIMIGMGMTEKQGGSDVRSNTTHARAIDGSGRCAPYLLTGHKWFFSVPTCDAHLVLAQADDGLSCFFVPRWRPDGVKNTVLIQRLKDKLGNRSNASGEVEFHDAWGVMVGEEGRGIPTIIDMANRTRLDCVIGSAGLMRHALVQAIHHARHRSAFGRLLAEQALMQNVLADLALESEAATHLMLRLARAVDASCDLMNDNALECAWRRILTPAAKFWICKRAIEFCGECMEVWGGNGYVEEAPMARMLREAPVNSIWEGSGNVMCLDVLRAIAREPEGFSLLLQDFSNRAAAHDGLRAMTDNLRKMLTMSPSEMQARRIAQQLALVAQGCLMLQYAPASSADVFIASRSDAASGRVFGTLPVMNNETLQQILQRAWPATA